MEFMVSASRRVAKCEECLFRVLQGCVHEKGPKKLVFTNDSGRFPVGCPHIVPAKENMEEIEEEARRMVRDWAKCTPAIQLNCPNCDETLDDGDFCDICKNSFDKKDVIVCSDETGHVHRKCLVKALRTLSEQQKPTEEVDEEECEVCNKPAHKTDVPMYICQRCARLVLVQMKKNNNNEGD